MENKNKYLYGNIEDSPSSIDVTDTDYEAKPLTCFNTREFYANTIVQSHRSSTNRQLYEYFPNDAYENWITQPDNRPSPQAFSTPISSQNVNSTTSANFDPFDNDEFPTLSSKFSHKKKKVVSTVTIPPPSPRASAANQPAIDKIMLDLSHLQLREESPCLQDSKESYEMLSPNISSNAKPLSFEKFCEEIDPDHRSNNSNASNTDKAYTPIQGPYGLMEYLESLQKIENKEISPALTIGYKMDSLGLDYNSSPMYETFRGPFADECGPIECDPVEPADYTLNNEVRDALPPMNLSKMEEDLIFFIFYDNTRNKMQLEAAKELNKRGWRFHIELKIWIARNSRVRSYQRNGNILRGMFYYFDANKWERLFEYHEIDIMKLENGDFESN